MKRPWILVDANNLAFRSFYAMRDLSVDGVGTAVAYGIFREVLKIKQDLNAKGVAFCFDVGESKRKLILPEYKSSRKDVSKSQKKLIQECRKQIDVLRTKHLPNIGFKNVFWQEGHEADDIIASIVGYNEGSRFVILSSDSDLYQLLANKRVSIYNLNSKIIITKKYFERDKGIDPSLWCEVKALAGCKTDDVPGIEGIGEKTAIQFLCGNLTKGKKFEAIVDNNDMWRCNLPIVTLPYPKTKPFKLKRDSDLNWSKTLKKLRINSLGHLIDGSLKSIKLEKG